MKARWNDKEPESCFGLQGSFGPENPQDASGINYGFGCCTLFSPDIPGLTGILANPPAELMMSASLSQLFWNDYLYYERATAMARRCIDPSFRGC